MIRFHWEHDALCAVYLHENYITVLDYDTMGWTGMSRMYDAFKDMAEYEGWKIIVEGTPGV